MSVDRSFNSFSELIPDLDDLDCEPQCVGSPKCGDFKIIQQCLKDGAEHGCFWSCD